MHVSNPVSHQKPEFTPGMRLSKLDVAVLVGGSVAAVAAGFVAWWIGFVICFVLAHFFLFCNVFRIARSLELAWAGIFVVLAAGTITFQIPGWVTTAAISLGATVVVVLLEMGKPSYHGVGWQRINPGLREWWELQHAKSA